MLCQQVCVLSEHTSKFNSLILSTEIYQKKFSRPASDKTIYAQPVKEKDFGKRSIETVIHVGTPIIGSSQAYGRTFGQGSQHCTPTSSAVPTTYQRLLKSTISKLFLNKGKLLL